MSHSRHKVFVHAPDRVMVGTTPIATSSWTYPLEEVTIDNVTTGSLSDVRAGMTILFGNAPGNADYGFTYVLADYSSGGIISLARAPQGNNAGEANLRQGTYVTVLNDYRVMAKIQKFVLSGEDVTIYKNTNIAVGTNTSQPPPVANTGPPQMGSINSVSGVLRAQFPDTGTNYSRAIAPSTTIVSYNWSLPTGVAFVGGYTSASDVIQVDAQPGFYWISLTVTDSNGKTHTSRTWLLADDPDDTYTVNATPVSKRAAIEGLTASFDIHQNLPKNIYPDGMLVSWWEGEPASPEDRSHIRFWGWHESDPAILNSLPQGRTKRTTLNCTDGIGRLKYLPGFTFTVSADSTNFNDWAYMPNANWYMLLHYQLHWHSTVLDLIDWHGDEAILEAIPFYVRTCAAANLYDQAQAQCKAVQPEMLLACNRLGQFLVAPNPLEQHPDDRTAFINNDLDESDIFEMSFENRYWPRYHWLRIGAVAASNTTLDNPFFSIAPGESPGQGTSELEVREAIVIDQTTLNEATGARYARVNQGVGRVKFDLGSNDHYLNPGAITGWVRIQVPEKYATQRGLYFGPDTAFYDRRRGLAIQVDYSYTMTDAGLTQKVSLDWEPEPLYHIDGVVDTSRGY